MKRKNITDKAIAKAAYEFAKHNDNATCTIFFNQPKVSFCDIVDLMKTKK